METAITTEALQKRFGRRAAVDGVDLRVPAGSVYGFLGQNGAGKTTTIRLVLGLLRPSAGSVCVFGRDVARERLATARMIGSLVETPALYDRLTGRENLEVARLLLGAPKSDIDRVLEVVDLRGAARRLAGSYSLGMRQRLGLARALLGGPRLLVLDEPTNGLDPDGIREMRELIRRLPEREGVTVFVSSHLLNEVEQIAGHVGLMHEGKLLAQSPLAALKARGAPEAELGVSDAAGAALLLHALGVQARVSGVDRVGFAPPQGGARALAELNRRLVQEGFEVFALSAREPSLEDIYLQMVSARSAPAAQQTARAA